MELAQCGQERRETTRRADLVLEVWERSMRDSEDASLQWRLMAATRFEDAASDFRAAGLGLSARLCLQYAGQQWGQIDDPDRLRACLKMIEEIEVLWDGS